MIRSPIKWVGGKSKLRKVIIPMIPEHKCYVEVFGGAAWVLFGKPPSQIEVLNDIDEDLINFFEVVKTNPLRLIRSFRWELASRARFKRLLEANSEKLDQIERAHRFYYLIMASWGGELGSARFQHSISDGGHGNRLIGALLTLEKRILPAYERLQTVQIECLPWETCIDQYDSPETFFYLDPPYPGNKCNYRHNMRSSTDHEALAARLRTIRGQWLLSTYESPKLPEIFAGCNFTSVKFPSGMAGNQFQNLEVLVTNYVPHAGGRDRSQEV